MNASLFTRFTFVILSCFIFSKASSQQYRKEIVVPNDTVATVTHEVTRDGGTIVAVKSENVATAARYINLIKLDSAGNMQWQQSFGPLTCSFVNVTQAPDSGYYLCATGYSAMSYMVLKTDKNGSLQFSKRLEVPSPYTVLHEGKILAKNDGGLYVTSSLFTTANATLCWHLFELSATGMVISSNIYDLNSSKTRCYSIDTCSNGDVLLLGSVLTGQMHRSKVARISPSGTLLWLNTYYCGIGFPSSPCDLMCDDNDNIFVLSRFNSTMYTSAAVTKIDGTGNGLWTMEYSRANTFLHPASITHTAAGEIVLTGDGWFIKTDPAGIVLASTAFSDVNFSTVDSRNPQRFVLSGDALTTTNGVILSTDASGNGCHDSTLVFTRTPRAAVDSLMPSSATLALQNFVYNLSSINKNIQVNDDCGKKSTGVDEQALPGEIKLFPNPANDQALITSASPIERIEIVDLNGAIVQTQRVNSSTCMLHTAALAEGSYFVRVHDKNGVQVRPLIIAH